MACLIIDTVQLGELHGEHHGTYKLGRWDWISRGYTPAGVEAWNAIRGIDLLESWPGIDGSRIGITGRSGGGAYSWYTAALDERIKVAVPVAGITDLHNHVIDGCVTGHCDCMYMINYYGWDYPKLAALIAPRPLLLANSDTDGIFPLDGVMRTHRQLKNLYAKLGASGHYGVIITPGPHKDTQELQVGAFRWLLRTLLGEETIISDAALKELEPAALAVFERETPADERVAAVGSWFVPSTVTVPHEQQAAKLFKEHWFPELRHTALSLPITALAETPQFEVTSLRQTTSDNDPRRVKLHQTTPADGHAISILEIDASPAHRQSGSSEPSVAMVHLGELDDLAADTESLSGFSNSPRAVAMLAEQPSAKHYFIRTRNANWQQADLTVKQKTQIVRRFYLLGQMPEQRELADVLSSLQWINRLVSSGDAQPVAVTLTGAHRSAAIATLAGLVCAANLSPELPSVAELRVSHYPSDPELAPTLPGLLRVCDYASLLAAARGSFPVAETNESSDGAHATQRLVDSSSEPQQACGFKIVEVGQDSARVWVRATRWALPNLGDLPAVRFASPGAKSKQSTGPILPATGVEG
ncbi:MAG: acetylxylan esterase, partial [Planctomycetales bacterium]|nr:acetylxylan esterase [Planctomycetales bacterium]